MEKPYTDIILTQTEKIRTFTEDTDSGELMWHRDRENRLVEVIEGNDWLVQMDNELPKKLTPGTKVYIPEGVYHRVIKGAGDLKVRITYCND
jgi:oxalate decarboxylase/phosphoglucose isomerase-like protein (cupin superfamily)